MANKKITDLQLRSSVTDGLNIPSDDGLQSYRITALQIWNYIYAKIFGSADELKNHAIVTSVGSSALTIALKTSAGADASSTEKIRVGFRSATLTSGLPVVREITGALSLVISNGSTLGQVSAQPSRIYVYLIDNAGTPELAVSHSHFAEDSLVSTTAEGGAGAADSATVMYSTTARSNVAVRLIGYILNTQTTAGTWASAGTQIQLAPWNEAKTITVTTLTSGSGTYNTPAGVKRLKIRMVGGGGGGGGSGTGGATNGGAGGNTTFGTSLLVANGGAAAGGGGGTGGTASLGTGPIGLATTGARGGGGPFPNALQLYIQGGGGASTPMGAGPGGGTSTGYDAPVNSGAGGSGGGTNNVASIFGGGGGGAGGFVDATINNPLASYAYAVGAAGTAGAAGTSGSIGGVAGAGVIYIEEHY